MHYATHCVAPVVALAKVDAVYVSCFGSGRFDEKLISKYGSPFAVESCHIKFNNSDLAAEVTRSLFNTSRQYRESFDVYGSKKSFEWTLIEEEESVIHTGEIPEKVKIPDYAFLLPSEIQSLQQGACTMLPTTSIFPLSRVPDMADLIHISCMNLLLR